MDNLKKGIDHIGVCVVFFCHDGKGNFIFAKRSSNARDEKNLWDVGGGALEFGSTVEENLKKEIKEEYNVDVLDNEFLGFRDVHRQQDGVKSHWIALDFKVLVNPKGMRINEPYKFDEIGWFTIDQAPQSLHSQLQGAIDKYKNKL